MTCTTLGLSLGLSLGDCHWRCHGGCHWGVVIGGGKGGRFLTQFQPNLRENRQRTKDASGPIKSAEHFFLPKRTSAVHYDFMILRNLTFSQVLSHIRYKFVCLFFNWKSATNSKTARRNYYIESTVTDTELSPIRLLTALSIVLCHSKCILKCLHSKYIVAISHSYKAIIINHDQLQ